MGDKITNQDISYQPKIEEYSFSRVPEEKRKSRFRLNTLFTLILIIAFIFFITLHYFNIFSINNVYTGIFDSIKPKLNFTSSNETENKKNLVSANGTLYRVSNKLVQVKTNNEITDFIFTDKTHCEKRVDLEEKDATNPAAFKALYTIPCFELNSLENRDKTVRLKYYLDFRKNKIIENISLE
jgi:hypothetical protein